MNNCVSTTPASFSRALVLALLLIGLPAARSQAQSIVNSTADTDDGACEAAPGDCTLREALNEPGDVEFDIPGPGPHVIQPLTDLPSADGQVVDGYTQPGTAPATAATPATILIVLDGALNGDIPSNGITRGTTRGLEIRDFTRGILDGAAEGCYLHGNGNGVRLDFVGSLVVGGTTPAARNVISDNASGLEIFSAGNVIQGNYIGTDPGGLVADGNGFGVYLTGGATNNQVGGTALEERNVISGNDTGVNLFGFGPGSHVVEGNFIGVGADSTTLVGNDVGIFVFGFSGTRIGGAAPGAANVIAGNAGAGVVIADEDDTVANAIRRNRIYANGGLGIDLGNSFGDGDGLTPNDPGDADDGPNNLQNFPVLSDASLSGGMLTVEYFVDSAPANAAYPITVEVFRADADAEEGRTFLGDDAFAAADFAAGTDKTASIAPLVPVGTGAQLVATATDADGNTSEFSGPVTATGTFDSTPPVCGAIEIERNDQNQLSAVNTSASDLESGIASVEFTTLRNLGGFVDTNGPFAEGETYTTPDPNPSTVEIRGERIDFAQGGAILTLVTNGAGLTANCDPVVERIDAELPGRFALSGNAPNPFRGETTIGFSVAEAASVRLVVYDLLGRRVATLADEELSAGRYEVRWDGRDGSGQMVAPGVYLYRIEAGAFSESRRMVLVR